VGNGLQKDWPYNFPIFSTNGSEIQLYITNIATGAATQITSNYSIDVNNKKVTYPLSGAALTSDSKITLLRVVPITQEIALPNGGAYFSKTIEGGLDKQTAISQQLNERISRTLTIPIGSDTTGETIINDVLRASADAGASADSAAKSAAQIPAVNVESTGYGIITGLKVSALSSMTVQISAGVAHMPNGQRFNIAGVTKTVPGAHATLPRIDSVFVTDLGGISYYPGTAATTPVAPAIPSGAILLANINVVPGATAIINGNIIDARFFKTNNNILALHRVDWVNVVEAGADPTGNRDCSSLVQYLLTIYSTLYFPKGNYRFNSGIVIPGNKTIVGESNRRDYTDDALGGVFFYFYHTSGYGILSAENAKNITLKNFCMLGNYAGGGGIRLYMTTAEDCFHKLLHIKSVKFSLDNIVLDNTVEPLLLDVQSLSSSKSGLVSSSFGVKITNSQFYDNDQHGVKFTRGGALLVGNKVFANGRSGSQYGAVHLTDLAFCIQGAGNSIHENYYNGIVFDGANVVNNSFIATNFAGNNKALGSGSDVVLGGSGNVVTGTTAISVKHSDGDNSSVFSVVDVTASAKNNSVNITTNRALLLDQNIFQFLAGKVANQKMVNNPTGNTLNSIVLDGTEYCIGSVTPKLTGFTNGGFTNYYNMYQVHGTTTYSLASDILSVTLAASDTLPVTTNDFSISALGQTGIKFTVVGTFGSVKNAFVEFDIKMGAYDPTLALCINGYFTHSTSVQKFFVPNYGSLGVYTAVDWIKIKIPVNFDGTVSVSEFNLIVLFVANVAGVTAGRSGNSFSIKNLKVVTY
jgi:hypothetical protein